MCYRYFLKKYNIKIHCLIHTTENLHVCVICNKSYFWNVCYRCIAGRILVKRLILVKHETKFSQKGELKGQLQRHIGKKPYDCKICNKTFSLKISLKSHFRTHAGENPHVCGLCNKGFSPISNLKTHLRIHTDEKPHVCKICNKGFSEWDDIKKHRLTHTGTD